MKRHTFDKLLPAIALAAMTGCVAEKLEYCPPRLFVTTDHEAYYGSRGGTVDGRTTRTDVAEWYGSIENVAVWVFDDDGLFVKLWTGGAYTVGQRYEIPVEALDLPDGYYNLVVWTNRGGMYGSRPADPAPGESIDVFTLDTELNPDGSMPSPRHRHYGELRVHISGSDRRTEYNVVVDPAVHRVHFTVKSDDEKFLTNGYSLTVADRNSSHDFHNRFIDGAAAYTRTVAMTAGGGTRAQEVEYSLTGSIDLLQIHDQTGTTIDITTGGVSILPEDLPRNLVELIKRVYSANGQQVDFEHTLEFDIDIHVVSHIRINFNINGWKYALNGSILGN